MTIPEVTTELVDEPTAAVNEEPAVAGGNELENVDPQILEALKSQKDRLYVLKLGETMEALILERSSRSRVEMLPATSYQRLLVHRCAAYYRLVPEQEPQTKAIIVTIAGDSRIPARRLAELVPPETSPLPAFKIMRRSIAPRTQSSNSTEDNSDENGSRSEHGSSANGKGRKKRMTIAEREAAYNEARSRIFMDFEEREKIATMSQTSASSSTLSLASGTTNGGGGSISAMSDGDGASTAPTESEYSGPAMGSKGSKGSGGDRRSLMSEPGPSRTMLRSNAPPFMGPGNGAGNGFSYPSLYEPAPAGYDHAAMGPNHGYNPQQPPLPPPSSNGYPMYSMYQYPSTTFMPPYGYYPYPYPQHPPSVPSTTPGESYPPPQPYGPPPHPSYWTPTGPQSPPQPRSINSPPPQHAPIHGGPPPPGHMQNYPPPPPQQQAAYGYHPPPAGYYPNQPPPPQPLEAQQSQHIHRNAFTNGQPQGHGPKSRPGSRDSATQNQTQHPFDPAKRNGPGPSRAPWSYGPGISMGGLITNGQHQQPHQQGLEGMGVRVMPPITLPLPQERRRPTSHGSGASHGSGGARTPADETASTASSSTGSSSSRRTFTSSSSKHPLPPRPDWAVGLKPGQTGVATPPRRPGVMYTPQGTQSPFGSQDASPAGSHPQSPAVIQPQSPGHQSSASLESTDFPPLVKQSQDFPPLGQGQKRPPAGAWNNAGGARAILVGTVPLNQTVNGVTISPTANGIQPGPSVGNTTLSQAVNVSIPTPSINGDPLSMPQRSDHVPQFGRFDEQDPAFERPPPRITAELFNPQQAKASKRSSATAQRVASPPSVGGRIASPANGRGTDARVASPSNGRAAEQSMESLVDKVGVIKLGESMDASSTP